MGTKLLPKIVPFFSLFSQKRVAFSTASKGKNMKIPQSAVPPRVNLPQRILRKITDKEIGLDTLFLQVSFIIIIRTFFEMVMEEFQGLKTGWGFWGESVFYIHFYISWLCIYLHFTVLIAYFTKMRLMDCLKIVMVGYLLILTVPFADFIYTGGKGDKIIYFETFESMPTNFLNMLNPFGYVVNVSFGVRLEVFVLLVGSFIFFYYVLDKKILKTLLLLFSMYLTIFFYGYLKAILMLFGIDMNAFTNMGVTPMLIPQVVLIMYIPPLLILSLPILHILWREKKDYAKAVAAFLYPSRLFFYLYILCAGFLVTSVQRGLFPKILNIADLMKLASAIVSIGFLFIYAKILNDVHDLKIDAVSNRDRPLVKGIVSKKRVLEISSILLPLSFLFAIITEKTFVYYWLVIWAMSHLYSVPPLRVRRFYPLGHVILSLISVLLFLAGGAVVTSYELYSDSYSMIAVVYVFSAFFFFSHIKDYKDVEGDRAARVGNILNILYYPKSLGLVFTTAFILSISLFVRVTGLENPFLCILYGLYLAVSSVLIFKARRLEDFERLLPTAFTFCIILSILCLGFR